MYPNYLGFHPNYKNNESVTFSLGIIVLELISLGEFSIDNFNCWN